MAKRSPALLLFLIALPLWLAMMTFVYRTHKRDAASRELGFISTSGVTFKDERRTYFSLTRNGIPQGYRSEARVDRPGIILLTDETVIKLNLAGISREVILQNTAAIDSATGKIGHVSFTLISGSHTSSFESSLSNDSLRVKVWRHSLDTPRTGVLMVHPDVIFPVTLPFQLSRLSDDINSFQVFDPLLFTTYLMDCRRETPDSLLVGDVRTLGRSFPSSYGGKEASFSVAEDGRLSSAEEYPLFGGYLGSISLASSVKQDIFMLPIEVKWGEDWLRSLRIPVTTALRDPRRITALTLSIEGPRAALLDLNPWAARILSSRPLSITTGKATASDSSACHLERIQALADTAVIGTTDYIQPHDPRIRRAALEVTGAIPDTLAGALALTHWVHDHMKKDPTVILTRSVDILRDHIGGSEEYTKLFAALARSRGIRTQINLGIVYDEGAFRYHSWPSVFVDGRWHDVDPYFDQETADATHLAFVRGDYDRLVELLRILAQLRITINDYR